MSRDVETVVSRIVQESLTNIQRHAGSVIASVSLGRLDERLLVEIADHSRGLTAGVRDDRDAPRASSASASSAER